MPQVSKNASSSTFEAIAVSVASPDDILGWSYGEVTKPETINYRTQKPERGGLFCERIFGPTKNWECYCGKYKRIRYKGVVCEKCGVEVTRAVVRRERMGHIKLAVPVTHIWYLRSTPSRLGLLLDLPIKHIEQVVYFAAYIVTDVDEKAKEEAMKELDDSYRQKRHQVQNQYQKRKVIGQRSEAARVAEEAAAPAKKSKSKKAAVEKDQTVSPDDLVQELNAIEESYGKAKEQLKSLAVGRILSEITYRDVSLQFGHVFEAGIGSEAIRKIIERTDLKKFIEERKEELKRTSGQKQKKIMKRLKLASSLLQANVQPEWMILTALPVIPPDLRPMVQLDGGRFAASDLNDLYRRVINRNNRLKRLIEIGAPEVICRNEKRMLQEAIDALLNTDARIGKTTYNVNERRKLRSLSDMLKGKQGRFRQNLLGKRVDYSGRSVIVVGPELKPHQCGLPKEMALKLFKPFVIGELIRQGLAYNVKNADRVIASGRKEVWDILETITADHFVLLNRAPTLHRLGIQAFQPVLIEGKAIRIYPLVCAAFNADFDGDQMAVHVPLSEKAQHEAMTIMKSSNNLLKPSSGEPIITPTQDMVLGCYYLTRMKDAEGDAPAFADAEEAMRSFANRYVGLQQPIQVRIEGEIHTTTVGRIMFYEQCLKGFIPFVNKTITKSELKKLVGGIFSHRGIADTSEVVDRIKNMGYRYATESGLSISMEDMIIPEEKDKIIEDSSAVVKKIINKYWKGLITSDERHNNVVRVWSQTKKDIASLMIGKYDKGNHIYIMVDSGARGDWGNVTQMAGMKGLVANPSGRTIELPIRANYKEGLSILEYFINTHSGRKGKSDTALKTSEAGYLTRRLVDSVQDIVVRETFCGSLNSREITRSASAKIGESFEQRIFGRVLAKEAANPKTGEIVAEKGTFIDRDVLQALVEAGVEAVQTHSISTCRTENGVCIQCYGLDLGNNKPVEIGTPVGIIAAQSIGEPGTQLTMQTFHKGGVAEGGDITQGLTRVEELFESRMPKTPAVITEIAGKVSVRRKKDVVEVTVRGDEFGSSEFVLYVDYQPTVKVGDQVQPKNVIARSKVDRNVVRATTAGVVESVGTKSITIRHEAKDEKTYKIGLSVPLIVQDGQEVGQGEPLTIGHLDLKSLMQIRGVEAVQEYIMNEVQHIYASQGQTINDKHVEIIVKQMFSKVRVLDPGSSPFLPGEIVNAVRFERVNEELRAEGKRESYGEQLLLGITKIALYTDSWLSAASFQETIRVLVEASVTKRVDNLKGLKENVIIGRLIPAAEIYRQKTPVSA